MEKVRTSEIPLSANWFLTILIAGKDSAKVLDYFSRNGAPCPPDVNPAEHIVEVIQGNTKTPIDWVDVWNNSPEREQELSTLHQLVSQAASESHEDEDNKEYANPKGTQFVVVLHRMMVQLWRSPVSVLATLRKVTALTFLAQDYVWNKINLHIFAALFGGFTFWKIGDSSFDLQLRLFAIFNFIFVAPGCINQMQPFFLKNRNLFETREKKVSQAAIQPVVLRVHKTILTCWVSSPRRITGLRSLVRRQHVRSRT